ncbi:hypothetical protein EB241_12575 [Erwinia psidii]|uniref:Transposase n=1 Tax=Erwinia psidii TaxID=69224 RepID=A0A3N6SH97_9GAMM|nr:hypothetical protein EB241_12575 [Erwinia psidii]
MRRIYRLLKLNFRRKGKKHLSRRDPLPLAVPETQNQCRPLDFMHNVLTCGQRFRMFKVVDNCHREALTVEIDLNIPAQRAVRVPDRLINNNQTTGCITLLTASPSGRTKREAVIETHYETARKRYPI